MNNRNMDKRGCGTGLIPKTRNRPVQGWLNHIRHMAHGGAGRYILLTLTAVLLLAMFGVHARAQEPASTQDSRILLSSVDSSHFPQVSARIHALGQNGLPLTGLAADEMLVVEDGLLTPSDAITLVGDTSSSLLTALVLDRSTDPASWSAIQSAVATFIAGLGPNDRAAVIVFGDDVQVVQDFTGDKTLLNQALTNTPAGGSFSAVNLGVQTALNLMAQQTGGRRSVLLMADRADNLAASPAAPASIPTVDELAQAVVAADATADVLGYGVNAIASSELRSLAEQTNGRRVFTTLPVELSSHLEALPSLLRQGYALTYTSQLPAADTEHLLTLALAGRSAPIITQFVSTVQPVQVQISRLGEGPPSAGQTVSGSVFVGVEADASAPITAVTFLLDGSQAITTTDEMVSGIVWDTTQTTPGAHTLTVVVEDQAGNTGQAEASLVVAPPLTLDVTVSGDEFTIGETFAITAVVDSYFGDTVVEAFVGASLVGLVSNPVGPARFDVDTNHFTPGRYALVVRARDNMGYSVLENGTILRLTPNPGGSGAQAAVQTTAPNPAVAWGTQIGVWFLAWWPWLAGIFVGLILLWLLAAIIRSIMRRRARPPAQVAETPAFHVMLTNAGNAATRYQLRAEEADEKTMTFRFSVAGMLLPPPVMMRAGANLTPMPQPVPAAAAPPPAGQPTTVKTASQRASSLAASSKSVAQGVGGAMYTASVAVELLNGLSSFLPNFLSLPLQQAAGALRQRQMMVRHAQTQAAMVTTEVKQTTGAGRELAGMAGKAAPVKAAQPAGAPIAQTVQPIQTAPPGANGAAPSPGAAQSAQQPVSPWVETAPILPGETLQVDVHVTPLKRLGKDKRISFRLHSRAADDEAAAAQIDDVSVDLTGR